jgi:hypothetical protein
MKFFSLFLLGISFPVFAIKPRLYLGRWIPPQSLNNPNLNQAQLKATITDSDIGIKYLNSKTRNYLQDKTEDYGYEEEEEIERRTYYLNDLGKNKSEPANLEYLLWKFRDIQKVYILEISPLGFFSIVRTIDFTEKILDKKDFQNSKIQFIGFMETELKGYLFDKKANLGYQLNCLNRIELKSCKRDSISSFEPDLKEYFKRIQK